MPREKVRVLCARRATKATDTECLRAYELCQCRVCAVLAEVVVVHSDFEAPTATTDDDRNAD